jgi:hypothetical protein
VLRQFTNLLSKTIKAWETFKGGEIRYFYVPHSDVLADTSWAIYLAAIDKNITELEDLRSSLQHQTELFENMTNSVSSDLDRDWQKKLTFSSLQRMLSTLRVSWRGSRASLFKP